MCDSGSHAHLLYLLQLDPRENCPNVCVCVFGCLCGCMWVRDTWRELGVAVLRQVYHPGRPVLTGWYVSFAGGGGGLLRGPHRSHACMTHGAVSVCLSVSRAKCVVLHGVAFKRATRQVFHTPWSCHQHSLAAHFSPYVSDHAARCNSTIVASHICGLLTSRPHTSEQDTVAKARMWTLFVDLMLC